MPLILRMCALLNIYSRVASLSITRHFMYHCTPQQYNTGSTSIHIFLVYLHIAGLYYYCISTPWTKRYETLFNIFQEINSCNPEETRFVGPKLVAKESADVGGDYSDGDIKMDFHKCFAKTQLKAKRLAVTFNRKVRERLNICGLSTSRVWDISFLACSVYVFREEGMLVRAVLAEKLLVPPSRYTKWNGNNGYVHVAIGPTAAGRSTFHPIKARGHSPRGQDELDPYDFSAYCEDDAYPHALLHPSDHQTRSTKLALGLLGKGQATMKAIAEDEEEEHGGNFGVESDEVGDADECSLSSGEEVKTRSDVHPGGGGARGRHHDTLPALRYFAPEAECYPQAFSHFTYHHTRRKLLVCDLQGVLSNSDGGEDRAGVFELTDPVIHYRSSSGHSQVFGKTDLGEKGVRKFFQTHQCNEVCHLLGVSKK